MQLRNSWAVSFSVFNSLKFPLYKYHLPRENVHVYISPYVYTVSVSQYTLHNYVVPLFSQPRTALDYIGLLHLLTI